MQYIYSKLYSHYRPFDSINICIEVCNERGMKLGIMYDVELSVLYTRIMKKSSLHRDTIQGKEVIYWSDINFLTNSKLRQSSSRSFHHTCSTFGMQILKLWCDSYLTLLIALYLIHPKLRQTISQCLDAALMLHILTFFICMWRRDPKKW